MIELILEEYLSSLKEKDELDILFPDLLKLEGYKVKSIPKTGERQYGVDLLAEKNGEVFLYVIKQGNLTRDTWNSNKNSVRQSIQEIFDVYFNSMLDNYYKEFHKNIVFVTNGIIADAVRPNWEGYKKQNESEDISISSILLPDLIKIIKKHGFNEHLFNKDKRSELRKCLYYLDEPDYKLIFFENIIDQYFQEITNAKNETQKNRLFSSLHMMIGMVNYNAIEKKRYRISVEFSEYIFISMWKYIEKEKGFEDEKLISWLNNFVGIYVHSNEKFVNNLKKISEIRGGIPSYNPVEYRLLCFDILGKLSAYGVFLARNDNVEHLKLKYSTKDVMDLLVNLMNNNYGFYYPVYDNDGIEISLFLYFSLLERKKAIVERYLEEYVSHIFANIGRKKYPILERQYSLAMEVEFGELDYSERYSASFLFGVIYEWAILIERDDIYNTILNIGFLNDVTIQNWNALSEEESGLYNKDKVHSQGYAFSLNDCEPDKGKKLILEESALNDFENFSFIRYSFPIIGLLISKKYRVPVIPSYWRKEFIECKT